MHGQGSPADPPAQAEGTDGGGIDVDAGHVIGIDAAQLRGDPEQFIKVSTNREEHLPI